MHAPAPPPGRPPASAGFTLLEVMIAMAIMAFVMTGLYMSIDATLHTQDLLDHEITVMRQGPRILDLVERDLRGVYLLDLEDDPVFLGQQRTMLGEPADSLTLVTTVDTTLTHRVDDREVPADLCETGYRLRAHPEIPDLLQLWRRQAFFVDDEPLEGGHYELVYDRVVAFQLRYLESYAQDAEPRREWDSRKRHALPKAVALRLEIEVGDRDRAGARRGDPGSGLRTLRYDRVIPLPDHADLTMRLHALAPEFAEAAAQAPNTGEGGAPGGVGGDAPGGFGPGGGGGGGPGPGPGPDGGGPGPGPGPDGGGGGDDAVDIDLDDLLDDLLNGGGGGG